MMKFHAAAALCAALTAGSALAAKLPLFDDFSETGLNPGRWLESESWRYVENGKANLGRWLYGGTTSDSGVALESFNLSPIVNGATPKSFGATIVVTNASTIEGCASNPAPSRPRARMIGSYFNARVGGPVDGDRTGDVLAGINVLRASDSTDAQGVMRVNGFVAMCMSADCNSTTLLHNADFGTVQVGTPLIGQIDWDKKANLFRFTRDKNNVIETPYTEPDGIAPVVAFTNVSLRNETANCSVGKPKAGLAATFDDVRFAF